MGIMQLSKAALRLAVRRPQPAAWWCFAIVWAGVALALLVTGERGVALGLVAASVLCAVLARPEQLKEVQLGEMRASFYRIKQEAEDAIQRLKKFHEISADATFDVVAQSITLDAPVDRDVTVRRVNKLARELRTLGIPYTGSAYRKLILWFYAKAAIHVAGDPATAFGDAAPRRTLHDWTSHSLREHLRSRGKLNAPAEVVLDDMKHFEATLEVRDPDVIFTPSMKIALVAAGR